MLDEEDDETKLTISASATGRFLISLPLSTALRHLECVCGDSVGYELLQSCRSHHLEYGSFDAINCIAIFMSFIYVLALTNNPN